MRGLLCLLMMTAPTMAGDEWSATAFRLTTAFHCQNFPGGEARYVVEKKEGVEAMRQSGATESDVRAMIDTIESEQPNGDTALSEGLCRALLD